MSNLTNMVLNAAIQNYSADAARKRREKTALQVTQLYDQFLKAGDQPAGFVGPPESPEAIHGKKLDAYSKLKGLDENPPLSLLQEETDLNIPQVVAAYPELKQYEGLLGQMSSKNAQAFVKSRLGELFQQQVKTSADITELKRVSDVTGIPVEKLNALSWAKKNLPEEAFKSTFPQYTGLNSPDAQAVLGKIRGGQITSAEQLTPKDFATLQEAMPGRKVEDAIPFFSDGVSAKIVDQTRKTIAAEGQQLLGYLAINYSNFVGDWMAAKSARTPEDLARAKSLPPAFAAWADRTLDPMTGLIKDDAVINRAISSYDIAKEVGKRVGPEYQTLLHLLLQLPVNKINWEAVRQKTDLLGLTLDAVKNDYAQSKGIPRSAMDTQ